MIQRLQQRAKLTQAIRQFFAERGVLEVETPLLCSHGVTDVFINSFECQGRYLQTSPEYAMKRLLVEGSGDIFQLCKSFRPGDVSPKHNPEFTMLEWYRVGFTHHDLMEDMDAFLQHTLDCKKAERVSYQDLFEQNFHINPHTAGCAVLEQMATQHGIQIERDATFTETTWLELLFTHCIEPKLGMNAPVFLYDFPVAQSALAKINEGVAERFEVYFKGVELANGFHELTDWQEQQQRFQADQAKRKQLGLPPMQIDSYFIDALKQGLPDCSGVALGIDRLLMLKHPVPDIKDVLAYGWALS